MRAAAKRRLSEGLHVLCRTIPAAELPSPSTRQPDHGAGANAPLSWDDQVLRLYALQTLTDRFAGLSGSDASQSTPRQ